MVKTYGNQPARGSYRPNMGRGGSRGRGGGRMNNRRQRMPTGEMIALAEYMHSTPTQMIYKALINDLVPMFNQEVYNSNQNGQVIGKIDEIMGQTANYMFTVIPAQGINSKNMKEGDKIYLDRAFFLPMTTFTNPQKPRGRGGRGGTTYQNESTSTSTINVQIAK